MVFNETEIGWFEGIVQSIKDDIPTLPLLFELPSVKAKVPEGKTNEFLLGFVLGRISGCYATYAFMKKNVVPSNADMHETLDRILLHLEMLRSEIRRLPK